MNYEELDMEAPIVEGFAKFKYIGEFYQYKATPQFLD